MLVLASVTNTLITFATHAVADLGLPGIFLLMVLDAMGIPAPSEITMLFAGYDVYTGHNSIVTVIAAGFLGDLVGASIAYGIGYFGRLELVERHGARFHLTPERMATGDRWFQRFGTPAIFFGRMVPLVRAFISFPAGAARMPFWRFLALSAAGALPWVAAWGIAGDALGPSYRSVQNQLHYVDDLIALLIVAGLAYFLWRRRSRVGAIDG